MIKKCFKYLKRFVEFKRASKESQIKWKENYVAPQNSRYSGMKVICISLKDIGKYTRYRSSLPEVFYKKVFLEISQNSKENTCARVSFLIKLQASGLYIKKETLSQLPATLLKRRLWYRCFPVDFGKFLGTPIFTELLPWLLL